MNKHRNPTGPKDSKSRNWEEKVKKILIQLYY